MSACTGCSDCPGTEYAAVSGTKKEYVVALAGNANVGKSAIFNQLTGTDQEIGNWPGKTVERAEGILQYEGHRLRIIDLPGIYSFATLSDEERISRSFIVHDHPDVVVNILDASALERNLFFTLQLAELGCPLVLAINQNDLAMKKGIFVDTGKLAKILGVPVVATVAIQGKGIAQLTDAIIAAARSPPKPHLIEYGKEVEERISRIISLLPPVCSGYPARWTAIKILEEDPDVLALAGQCSHEVIPVARACARELVAIHGESAGTILSGERYHAAEQLGREVMSFGSPDEFPDTLTERIDRLALHPVFGYLLLALVLGGLLVWTFFVGAWVSEVLTNLLSGIAPVRPLVTGSVSDIVFNGAWTGFVAAVTLIIPYVVPFYLFLSLIEDSGFLTRVSVMLDKGLHRLGLHGKAIIPLILGFGCSVPACLSCRIIESPKQRFLAAFLVTIVPCSARTVVILGVVAAFVNVWWAIALYIIDFVIIIVAGRFAFRVLPGESVGMIMEMPEYHIPSPRMALGQTWSRTKSLIWIVLPSYIIGSIAITAAYSAGLLDPINAALSPVTVFLLGLPAVTGIVFVFGIIRKEMTILTLAALFGTTIFSTVLTPVQLIVLALVTMLYIPCVSTILALAKDFGWRKTLLLTIGEIVMAVAIGAVAFRLLSLFM